MKLTRVLITAGLLIGSVRADAQIFVSSLGSGSIAEYDQQSGALIDPNFISGLTSTAMGDVVYNSGALYVASGSFIGQYDATTGAVIDPTFAQPAYYVGQNLRPFSLQFTPNALFVLSVNTTGTGNTGEIYRLAPHDVAPTLVAGSESPPGISPTLDSFVVIGQNMWTADSNFHVSEYTNVFSSSITQSAFSLPAVRLTTDGTDVFGAAGTNIFKVDGMTRQILNANFITTPGSISDLNYANGILYVADGTNIATYDASTGALLNAQFISGTSNVIGIAVEEVPETSTLRMFCLGVLLIGATSYLRRRRAQRT